MLPDSLPQTSRADQGEHFRSNGRPMFDSLARLGIHPLIRYSVLLQAVIGTCAAWVFRDAGISINWMSLGWRSPIIGLLLVAWAATSRRKAVLADCLAAQILLLTFAVVGLPAMYAAIAFGRPLIDERLAAADATLGISMPALVSWTRGHQPFLLVTATAYATLIPQLLALPSWFMLTRDRVALWRFVFHYQFWWTVALIGAWLWPAATAIAHYGYVPITGSFAVADDCLRLHAGTYRVFSYSAVQGLISLPSFHTSAALLIIWTSAKRVEGPLLLPLNIAMIAGTFVTGQHYGVDVLSSIAIFPLGIWCERRCLSRWTQTHERQATDNTVAAP